MSVPAGRRLRNMPAHGNARDWSSRASTSIAAQCFEVANQVVEVFVVDPLTMKGRHRSEPNTDLRFHQELRQGLIIDRRPEPGFSARMALVTVLHENNPSLLDARIIASARPDQRLAAT